MHCCAYPRRTTQEVNKTIIIQLCAKIHRSTWIRTTVRIYKSTYVTSVTNTTAPSGVVGTSYSFSAATTSLPSPVYSVTPALPLGLSLNTSTGAISGIPTTTTASNTYTVTAAQGGCSATRGYAITISCPTITFTNTTATSGVVGTSYSLNAVATGLPSLVYSVSPGLPLGLSLNTSTGAISGTPTTATASNTYTVTAAQGGCSNTQGYTFAIACPAIIFTNTTAPIGVVGNAYSFSAGATGNTATLTYSVTPALPLGLSLNTSNGLISGTPTAQALSATYTVTATQGTCNVIQAYTFAVNCSGFAITPVTLPNGTATIAYNQTLSTTLTGTLVWSVDTALPAGISLNTSTGVISGTSAVVVASVAYTVSVSNGACSTSRVYNVAFLTPCSPVVLNPNLLALPNATLGVPYSLTMTATGGTVGATYSYTTLTPMPEGLKFVNGFLSGTPKFSTSVTFLVKAVTPSGCEGSRVYTLVILPDPATALDNSLSSLIKVYPNPSNGIFNVDFAGLNLGKSLVRAYDAQGKVVYSSEINNNETSISLENRASGIYLMEVSTDKGRILKRLVKE